MTPVMNAVTLYRRPIEGTNLYVMGLSRGRHWLPSPDGSKFSAQYGTDDRSWDMLATYLARAKIQGYTHVRVKGDWTGRSKPRGGKTGSLAHLAILHEAIDSREASLRATRAILFKVTSAGVDHPPGKPDDPRWPTPICPAYTSADLARYRQECAQGEKALQDLKDLLEKML